MGSKKNAGSRAAQAEIKAAQLGIDEIRRQFDITQDIFATTRGQLDPFVEAGVGALGSVQKGGTVQGIEDTIAEIMGGGAFGSLVGERQTALQGQLAAGGLTRSGKALEEAAAIPTDLAFNIENLLFGRQANLVGSGQNAALGLGSLAGQLGSQGGAASGSVAALLKGQGVSEGAGILTNAQARSSVLKQGLGIASSIFFSDERLKENIEVVARIGDLDIVQWDWLPFTRGTPIDKCGTLGFLAQDVEAKYPQYVQEWGGWKIIDLPCLLDELEIKYASEMDGTVDRAIIESNPNVGRTAP